MPASSRPGTFKSRAFVAPPQSTIASNSFRRSSMDTFAPTLAFVTKLIPSAQENIDSAIDDSFFQFDFWNSVRE